MKKEKDIIIRVTEKFKKELQEKAVMKGLSLSSFIRLILIKNVFND